MASKDELAQSQQPASITQTQNSTGGKRASAIGLEAFTQTFSGPPGSKNKSTKQRRAEAWTVRKSRGAQVKSHRGQKKLLVERGYLCSASPPYTCKVLGTWISHAKDHLILRQQMT